MNVKVAEKYRLFLKNNIDIQNHVLSLEEVLMIDPFTKNKNEYVTMLNFSTPVYGISEHSPMCKFMPDRNVIEPMIRANITFA